MRATTSAGATAFPPCANAFPPSHRPAFTFPPSALNSCLPAFLPSCLATSGSNPDFLEHRGQRLLRARDRQVADVEMPRADVDERADRPRADLLRLRARGELARQRFRRHREKA